MEAFFYALVNKTRAIFSWVRGKGDNFESKILIINALPVVRGDTNHGGRDMNYVGRER